MGFKVHQLRSILQSMPDEAPVVVRCDAQGEAYSPLSIVEQGVYAEHGAIFGGFVGPDELDDAQFSAWTPNAVALTPVLCEDEPDAGDGAMVRRAWLIALLLAILALAIASILHLDGLVRTLTQRPRTLPLRVLAPLAVVGRGLASLMGVGPRRGGALGGLHG